MFKDTTDFFKVRAGAEFVFALVLLSSTTKIPAPVTAVFPTILLIIMLTTLVE